MTPVIWQSVCVSRVTIRQRTLCLITASFALGRALSYFDWAFNG